jgi:hypothetical protein
MLSAFTDDAKVVGVINLVTPSEISRGPHFKTPANISKLAIAADAYVNSRERRITSRKLTFAES